MKYLITIPAVFIASVAFAELPDTGEVETAAGTSCAYTQLSSDQAQHFFGEMVSNNATIKFEPGCVEYSPENVELINAHLANWYPGEKDGYMVASSDLSPGGADQQRGQCIKPVEGGPLGIAVDHIVEDGSIVEVVHTSASSNCSEDEVMMMLEEEMKEAGS